MQMPKMKTNIFIQNFRGLPKVQMDFVERQWCVLEPEVVSIMNNSKLTKGLEELYQIVQNLTTPNSETLILNNLRLVIETFLLEKLYKLMDYDENFLEIIRKLWQAYRTQMRTVKNIFINFERNPKKGQVSVQTMASLLFKNTIILNKIITTKIFTNLNEAILKERKGDKIDEELIKSTVDMLEMYQTYTEVFHNKFLVESNAFYASEGKTLLTLHDVCAYFKYVQLRIENEQQRKHYLSAKTCDSVVKIVEKNLIEVHLHEILEKNFVTLISNANYAQITLMHDLILRVSVGKHVLLQYFATYVNKKALEIVNMIDENIVNSLIVFKEKVSKILDVCFRKDADTFSVELRKCLESVINTKSNKVAQLLAKFIDQKLRAKDLNLEQLEMVFTNVMFIFRLVQGKDIFEAFYKKHLSKRLLLGKTTNDDAENSIISKLKYECGESFTSKIEGMFNDISISREIHACFKKYMEKNVENHDMELNINVLTLSYWPTYPNFNINLPVQFCTYQTLFQKFYTEKHSGRKLMWQPNLDMCILKADFKNGKKELQVSLFQGVILLLFNNTKELTYNEIKEITNLDETELKRTVISLSCGRSRVLSKTPKGLDITPLDLFTINENFTDKLFRVKINQIQLKTTKEEEQATEKSVLNDRQCQIDAAIVRILKSNKCISHNSLISEIYNVLAIPVSPSDLKKRIEGLIEREYIERDAENSSMYKYVA